VPAGAFITLEGGEGCGKSTQARLLAEWLNSRQVDCLSTREPGGTPLGDEVRRLLKRRTENAIAPLAELMLMEACRAQLVNTVIRPALRRGQTVVCDRYTDSSLAYQGHGRGVSLETVVRLNNIATGGLMPDLTVLLDLAPEQGLARKNNCAEDRFESEDLEFHRRVRAGYRELAAAGPDRWLVVDAGLGPAEITRLITTRLEKVPAFAGRA
jgi:dTMP kinase